MPCFQTAIQWHKSDKRTLKDQVSMLCPVLRGHPTMTMTYLNKSSPL